MSERHVTAECAWCGTEFEVNSVGRPSKYCKRSCRQRAYESRVNGVGAIRENLKVSHDSCYLCGDPLDWDSVESPVVFDHMIATVHGGETNVSNLRPVHLLCNARKGSSLVFVPSSDGRGLT